MTLRPMLAALASAAAVFSASAGAAALPEQIHVEYSGSVLVAVPVANITISAWLHDETYAGAANFRAGGLLRWFDDTDIVASTTGYRTGDDGRALSPWRYEHIKPRQRHQSHGGDQFRRRHGRAGREPAVWLHGRAARQ